MFDMYRVQVSPMLSWESTASLRPTSLSLSRFRADQLCQFFYIFNNLFILELRWQLSQKSSLDILRFKLDPSMTNWQAGFE